MAGDLWGLRCGRKHELSVRPDRNKGGAKFGVKWGTRVLADENAKRGVGGGGATAAKSVAKQESPANPPTSLRKPCVDGTTLEFRRELHGKLNSRRRVRVMEVS